MPRQELWEPHPTSSRLYPQNSLRVPALSSLEQALDCARNGSDFVPVCVCCVPVWCVHVCVVGTCICWCVVCAYMCWCVVCARMCWCVVCAHMCWCVCPAHMRVSMCVVLGSPRQHTEANPAGESLCAHVWSQRLSRSRRACLVCSCVRVDCYEGTQSPWQFCPTLAKVHLQIQPLPYTATGPGGVH